MNTMYGKRWLTGVLAALLVLAAGLVGPVTPVAADGGGQLIQNTVFTTVVKQDISYSAQLNVPGLVGNPLTGVDLSDNAAITAALVTVGVDPTSITIDRSQTLLNTTTTDALTYTVVKSPNAQVIGDTSNLAANLLNGTALVAQGTVTVTTTDTTIKTQHILETVAITGNLASTPCAYLSMAEGSKGHRGAVVANVFSPCQGGAPIGFLVPTRVPQLHDLHLSTLVVQGHQAIVYGWGKMCERNHHRLRTGRHRRVPTWNHPLPAEHGLRLGHPPGVCGGAAVRPSRSVR